jgi:LuxR family maltose regulon positive regulatory protein
LRALSYQAKGNEKQALDALRQALELGEPENRVVSFLREGAPMERLLKLGLAASIAPLFVRRLLVAFKDHRNPQQETSHVTELLAEPFSVREMEILKLLEKGCSDKIIAKDLVIAQDTVHKHLGNIYGKLDVHNRMEAIQHARQLGLL